MSQIILILVIFQEWSLIEFENEDSVDKMYSAMRLPYKQDPISMKSKFFFLSGPDVERTSTPDVLADWPKDNGTEFNASSVGSF